MAEVQRPVRWSWPSPPHEGEELDRDSVDLQVGFRWDNPERGMSFDVTSTGRFSDDAEQYDLRAAFNMTF